MNKYEEALNTLKPNDEDVIHHKDGWWNRQNKAIDTIKELVYIYPEYLDLKAKATPIKPKNIKQDEKTFGNINGKCPNCTREVFGDCYENYDKYCSSCGQKLDWSDK